MLVQFSCIRIRLLILRLVFALKCLVTWQITLGKDTWPIYFTVEAQVHFSLMQSAFCSVLRRRVYAYMLYSSFLRGKQLTNGWQLSPLQTNL